MAAAPSGTLELNSSFQPPKLEPQGDLPRQCNPFEELLVGLVKISGNLAVPCLMLFASLGTLHLYKGVYMTGNISLS